MARGIFQAKFVLRAKTLAEYVSVSRKGAKTDYCREIGLGQTGDISRKKYSSHGLQKYVIENVKESDCKGNVKRKPLQENKEMRVSYHRHE